MAERVINVLQCTVCRDKNYYFATGKKKEKKVEVNKFCRKCRKHTPHKAAKV